MSDVTQILERLEDDDPAACQQLFIAVYDELRRLAAQQLQGEKPGQTLQATAIVHEAWLRLMSPGVDGDQCPPTEGLTPLAEGNCRWKSRSHFFGAAAEAMRRILVDNARRKNRLKRGRDVKRTQIDLEVVVDHQGDDILEALDSALQKLETVDAKACELVKLRYFAGLSLSDASRILNIAPRTADRLWAYAKAWLLREIQ
jgi:RNA polymerase sigma factor (sigma-70 family)